MTNETREQNQDCVYYKSSESMDEVADNSIDLIITSPPYFTVKDYSKKGGVMKRRNGENGEIFFELTPAENITERKKEDVGNIHNYQEYLKQLNIIWKECERVLKPAGKLCLNLPFRNAINKVNYSLSFDIHKQIIENTELLYYDRFVWDKNNRIFMYQKGTWPMPGNIQTWIMRSEDIIIFVKKGEAKKRVCEQSKITKQEFQQWIRPIWVIPTSRDGIKTHIATFPYELANRLIRLYSFVGDIILDPFAGSGTVLAVAKQNQRHYVGYELYEHFKEVINRRLNKAKINL